MNCWKCNIEVSDSPLKIGFRARCSNCDVDLHVCKNCRYSSLGKPNDCIIPGTDPIADREQSNLCEEFKPNTKREEGSKMDRARQVFGEDAVREEKNFDDLFK